MIVSEYPGTWHIIEETYLQDVPVYVLEHDDYNSYGTIVVHVEPNSQGYYVQI